MQETPIPGSGRSTREGIGYPLHYSWASLVAQLVKNLPEIQETWVRSWVRKIPWRREDYPLQYSDLENSMGCIVSPWGHKQLDMTEQLSLNHCLQ